MLCQENLEKIESLPVEDTIMAKFLKDNKLENNELALEIENNMPFAMSYYNEEAKSPYLFRRISNSFEFEESYQSKQIYNIEALNDSQISFSIDDFDSDRP